MDITKFKLDIFCAFWINEFLHSETEGGQHGIAVPAARIRQFNFKLVQLDGRTS
jgi:hypothetical protein